LVGNFNTKKTSKKAKNPNINAWVLSLLIKGGSPSISDCNKKAFSEEKAFVLEAGIEPARPNGHKILSLACLPVPPLELQYHY
jgi:hypothetical protein